MRTGSADAAIAAIMKVACFAMISRSANIVAIVPVMGRTSTEEPPAAHVRQTVVVVQKPEVANATCVQLEPGRLGTIVSNAILPIAQAVILPHRSVIFVNEDSSLKTAAA